MSDAQQEPKIIVDEDWKSKVEREKEAAEAARQESQRQKEQHTAHGKQAPRAGAPEGQLPPASFPALVTSLAAQALMALGQAPDPAEGHPVVRPDLAKHCIDTLGMLDEKTRGNLTPEETKMLADVLHDLRMLFVSVGKVPQEKGNTEKDNQ